MPGKSANLGRSMEFPLVSNQPDSSLMTSETATNFRSALMPPFNAKVSDGSQPPVTCYLSLSESAGSRSLHVWLN